MATGPVLGNSNYIYGVLPIPNDSTAEQRTSPNAVCAATGDTCPTVYHCADGLFDISTYPSTCGQNAWGFAYRTSGNGGTSCVPAFATAGNQTKPNPYNYMRGLVPNGAPSVKVPSVNGQWPDQITSSDPATGLATVYAAFTDDTTRSVGNGCGSGWIIVAYKTSWFVTGNTVSDITNINTFLALPWVNSGGTESETTIILTTGNKQYQGANIPNIYWQVYNYVLLGDGVSTGANLCGTKAITNCTNTAGTNSTTCSTFYADIPGNPCGNVLSILFTDVTTESDIPSATSPLAEAYAASANAYCTAASKAYGTDGVGNTGPVECFCQDPSNSSLFTELTDPNNAALNTVLPRQTLQCWWTPCGTGYTNRTLPVQGNYPYPGACTGDTVCANIVEAAGSATFKDAGSFNQYINCDGPGSLSGGGSPSGPGGNPTNGGISWWVIGGVVLAVIVLVSVLVFFGRKHADIEEDEKPKKKKSKPAAKPATTSTTATTSSSVRSAATAKPSPVKAGTTAKPVRVKPPAPVKITTM